MSKSGHFTRSSLTNDENAWSSAGVCPLSFDSLGVCHALLGEEEVGGGGKRRRCYSDFGGRREAADESPMATAAREATEESLGSVFGPVSALISILSDPCRATFVVQRFPSGSSYHQFFALSIWATDPVQFKCLLDSQAHRPARGAEKKSIVWVPLQLVIDAATRQGSRRNVIVLNRRRIRLRPCFAQSISLAASSKCLTSLISNGQASFQDSLPKIEILKAGHLSTIGGNNPPTQNLDPVIYSRSMSYALNYLQASSQPPV